MQSETNVVADVNHITIDDKTNQSWKHRVVFVDQKFKSETNTLCAFASL